MRVEFSIYREISHRKATRTKKGGMEIAVLTVHSVGGQAIMKSVNRHIEMIGGKWIGRHPDYYDGVNTKNIRAEEMFSGLENELEKLTQKLGALDEDVAQWVEPKKLNEFATEIATRFNLDCGDVLDLFFFVQPNAIRKLKARRTELMDEAINVGVKKEHAQNYLADVQRDFPRLVAYVHQK